MRSAECGMGSGVRAPGVSSDAPQFAPLLPTPLRLGPLTIDPPTVLAPMAGLTSAPFRLLCREQGCGLVVSDLLSANAIVYGSEKTGHLMRHLEAERPVCLQLFGGEPQLVAEAARRAEQTGVDALDLNMGCPVPKVAKAGAGCVLMRNPERAAAIARAVTSAVSVPVTVKTRLGWNHEERNAVEFARRLEQESIAAITVHGRVGSQGYGGRADWAAIGEVKGVWRPRRLGRDWRGESGGLPPGDRQRRRAHSRGRRRSLAASRLRRRHDRPRGRGRAAALPPRGTLLPDGRSPCRSEPSRANRHCAATCAHAGGVDRRTHRQPRDALPPGSVPAGPAQRLARSAKGVQSGIARRVRSVADRVPADAGASGARSIEGTPSSQDARTCPGSPQRPLRRQTAPPFVRQVSVAPRAIA